MRSNSDTRARLRVGSDITCEFEFEPKHCKKTGLSIRGEAFSCYIYFGSGRKGAGRERGCTSPWRLQQRMSSTRIPARCLAPPKQ